MIPDSDKAVANAVQHEAATIALGPGNERTKMAALEVVLDFTKARPGQRGTAGHQGWRCRG